MKKRLYDEYLKRLIDVNDETKTIDEHQRLTLEFRGWIQGVNDAAGYRFNGDYYYIEKGIDRPMCCGEFLDWTPKDNDETNS